MKFDQASIAQFDAADPSSSTWLSANAGSGKTRVLTDRVARLLLAGVRPQNILCLTYTKAAASEMQNRLFHRLGKWAMMSEKNLRASLINLGIETASLEAEKLRKARTLFALAIETPGGLKIQTIHSFCAALLRRFPLEAGVSPNFAEIDDRTGKLIRAEVLEQVATLHESAMTGFAHHFSGAEIDPILRELVQKKHLFMSKWNDDSLAEKLGHSLSDLNEHAILDEVFDGSETRIFENIIPLLRQGSVTDQRLADDLNVCPKAPFKLTDLAFFESKFLTGSKTKTPFSLKASPPTKATRGLSPDLFEEFDLLRTRVADARPRRLAALAFQRTRALRQFADRFLPAIERAKQTRSMLDFDDLIHKARALLQDKNMAAWVLFRIDGGIDHILVDEAQDTSPAQWDVVRSLADEFTSGESARSDVARTLFVVGDQKQSIYSFQGADPAGFETMRNAFQTKHKAVDKPFASRELLYSFRSASEILQLVDATFSPEFQRGMGGTVTHLAFKNELPGRVDLWPWITPDEKQDKPPWYSPVDTVATNHHTVQLAKRIADFIEDQIAHGQLTVDERDDGISVQKTRRITPGDFLILVQKRSGVFHPIIQECKRRGIPLAGADRLRMGGELGVKDLIALLSYLATPEDDLSLATVLRSPMGNVSEAELYQLAQGRNGNYLRARLEASLDRFPQIHAMLHDLRNQADFLRPYEILERALTRHGARERLIARLGSEAEEGIEALLNQALNYEQLDVPSLTGFLTWLESDEVDIKRQIDSNSDLVRVMTVHGAKGLEAPIVILPDTAPPRSRIRQDIFEQDTHLHWAMPREDMPQVQADLHTELSTRELEERRRLLYVAMTRAENWLVVCGSGDLGKNPTEHWYGMVESGMSHAGAVPTPDTVGLTLSRDWPVRLETSEPHGSHERSAPANWATQRATVPAKVDLRKPSDLGGAKVISGDIPEAELGEDAKALGTALHLLLETLPGYPESDWELLARALVSDQIRDKVWTEALSILRNAKLAHVFAADSLPEVNFTAVLSELGGARVTGAIDRLIVTDTKVTAVDFKSNQAVPEHFTDAPEGLLRQMGAYHAALSQIYPDHEVETAILWTKTAELMVIPHDIVRNALLRAHTS